MTSTLPTRTLSYRCADGVKLAGEEGGDPDAPTVILLHGGGQTRHSWDGAMQALIGRGYHVINLDARGHGDSDWSREGNYQLRVLADDLCGIIGSLPQPPALVGASMGGITALLAIARESRTTASVLVLVDVVPQMELDGVKRIFGFMRGNAQGFASLEEAAAAVSAYNPHRPRPRDPSGLMKNLRLRADGRLHWHWDPNFFSGDQGLEPPSAVTDEPLEYRNIRLPVLLVRGLSSDLVTVDGVENLRSHVPQLEVFDVDGAGHMVVGDRNDAFNQGILEFLQRHLPARGRGAQGPSPSL